MKQVPVEDFAEYIAKLAVVRAKWPNETRLMWRFGAEFPGRVMNHAVTRGVELTTPEYAEKWTSKNLPAFLGVPFIMDYLLPPNACELSILARLPGVWGA